MMVISVASYIIDEQFQFGGIYVRISSISIHLPAGSHYITGLCALTIGADSKIMYRRLTYTVSKKHPFTFAKNWLNIIQFQ